MYFDMRTCTIRHKYRCMLCGILRCMSRSMSLNKYRIHIDYIP